jgi:uncharacterized OsmC-like protein
MDTHALRSAQATLKARYREDPAAARATLRARGRTVEPFGCEIESGGKHVVAGMHPGIGGSGAVGCPGDLLLEALVACAGVTVNVLAAGLGIGLRGASIEAEGDLDFRGVMGLSSEVPIGFGGIRLTFVLDTDATDGQIETLMRRTEACCVVQQSLASEVVVTHRRAGA